MKITLNSEAAEAAKAAEALKNKTPFHAKWQAKEIQEW